MALNDLVTNNQAISEELLERVLKGRVRLVEDQEEREVSLTREVRNFPIKTRVLLFLAGGRAWELIKGGNWDRSPSEMVEALSVLGNSLRPSLKELEDQFLVKSEKGRYRILPEGIFEMENLILPNSESTKTVSRISPSRKTPSQKASTGGKKLYTKSRGISDLVADGYFSSPHDMNEIISELGRRGTFVKATSFPSFVLPLLRKKILTRDRQRKGQREIWVYRVPGGDENG